MKALLLISLGLMCCGLSQQKEVLSATNDICRLFPSGAQIRKPGTCDEWVICEGGKSTTGGKCPAGQQWKLDTKACTTASKVTDDYCSTPCKKTSGQYLRDKKTCSGWVECNGSKEQKTGTCPSGQIFDEKNGVCAYNVACQATFEFCNISPLNQVFRDSDNCHKYYICNKSAKLEVKTCEIGHYYDTESGECIAKAQVGCYKHPLPEEVCGNIKVAKRGQFVSDEATCNGYFHCKDLGTGKPDLDPTWNTCMNDLFFNPELQACSPRLFVKCPEDRCIGRKPGDKEMSERKGCHHYLVCGDGWTEAEEQCPDDLYFNPLLQKCVSDVISYPACE